ncbi:MAG: EamA family transporter RarD [Nostocoides sp.]
MSTLGGEGVPSAPQQEEVRKGTAYGFIAYGLWGLFPLYFHALAPSGAFEILAHRIVWTFVLCAIILLARGDLRWVRAFGSARLTFGVVLAALVIAANWVIYVYAVLTGHTYEAALGYFLNPLVTVGLGVVVLGEQLRPMQWAAVAVGVVAALVLTLTGEGFPWLALCLAFSFGFYGLLKKRIGVSLQAMHSLAAETAVLTPIALVILGIVASHGDATFIGFGGWHTALLVMAGPVTAVPLLLFAAATRRIPLVTVGLIQFITPVLQLLASVFILKEHVTGGLWIGFGIVWVALVLLTLDAVRTSRQPFTPLPPGEIT